ncbi:MAG TPA: sigma-70 family RNA polymerase sigma factor [Thermoanaerobaculia bacterium]
MTTDVSPPSAVEAAADEIYTSEAPLLRYVAIEKFRVPRDDADALVHDVFTTYLARATTVRNPRPYLVGAICNAARHYWRERKNEEAALAKCDLIVPAQPELVPDTLGRKLLLATTLSRIGSKCRELLRRYYLEGESTASIACSRDTSSDYVLFLLHRCRKSARSVVRSLLS